MVSSLGQPAYTTIRQWLCKLGLYKLTQPKDNSSKYFHVIDVSIQMGRQKFVLVLGIKQKKLIKNFSPTFEEVEILVLRPLESCTGEVVRDILKEAATITGMPLAIISDGGSDLKKGVRLFKEEIASECQEGVDEPAHLSDCSHKLNNYLKYELKDDEVWDGFKKAASEAIQHLKLSPIAHLAPPRQRAKDRMHSGFSLIEWGLSLSDYVKSDKAQELPIEQMNKISWIREYELSLLIYKNFMDTCKIALNLTHKSGYSRWTACEFAESMDINCYIDQRCLNFHKKIEEFLQEEGVKVPDGQHYLSSTEIEESFFGKFKKMEDHHSGGGLTSLILAVPALAGKIDESEIYNAMTEVSVKDLDEWLNLNMGETFLSKRRQDLQPYKEDVVILATEKRVQFGNLDLCEFSEAFAM